MLPRTSAPNESYMCVWKVWSKGNQTAYHLWRCEASLGGGRGWSCGQGGTAATLAPPFFGHSSPHLPFFSPSFATVTPPFFSRGHFPIKKSIWRFPKKATPTSTHVPSHMVSRALFDQTHSLYEMVFLIQTFKVVFILHVDLCILMVSFCTWNAERAKGYEVKVYI